MNDFQHGSFGIKLGLTRPAIAHIGRSGRFAVTCKSRGDRTTTSVGYFENYNCIATGKAAGESAGVFPSRVVSLINREMGDWQGQRAFLGREFLPLSVSALILGAVAGHVVIAVLAHPGLLERDRSRKAGDTAVAREAALDGVRDMRKDTGVAVTGPSGLQAMAGLSVTDLGDLWTGTAGTIVGSADFPAVRVHAGSKRGPGWARVRAAWAFASDWVGYGASGF